MRAASESIEKPAQVSKPRPTLPMRPVKPIRSSQSIKRDEPSDAAAPSHRRKIQVVKSEPAPDSKDGQETPPERTQPTPQMRAPTPEEVEADPLVKSVLDVFAGEIKRVHPKNK
jgi:hypothetical protein